MRMARVSTRWDVLRRPGPSRETGGDGTIIIFRPRRLAFPGVRAPATTSGGGTVLAVDDFPDLKTAVSHVRAAPEVTVTAVSGGVRVDDDTGGVRRIASYRMSNGYRTHLQYCDANFRLTVQIRYGGVRVAEKRGACDQQYHVHGAGREREQHDTRVPRAGNRGDYKRVRPAARRKTACDGIVGPSADGAQLLLYVGGSGRVVTPLPFVAVDDAQSAPGARVGPTAKL